jgi:D-arabinose 1-dehydrogenase-like Zn-dependent alcohol dehydrogenase
MQAVRFTGVGEPVILTEDRVPEPGPGEVRVAVRACGICGSDVHIVDGSTAASRLPVTLGHEPAGVVDAVGTGVTGLEEGRPVAIAAFHGCGACAHCAEGRDNLCGRRQVLGLDRPGAQAEFVVVPARIALPLPAGVDFVSGAIATDAVATPFHAVRLSGVRSGQTAVVYGLGGLGLHAVMILRQVIGARVIGVDAYPGALDRALAFGADAVVDASEGAPARAVRELTDGGADAAFEFVGAPRVVEQALKSLRPGGSCVAVGVGPDPLHLAVRQETLVGRELRLQGSFGYTLPELRELLGLLGDGRLDVTGTVTHRLPLARTAEGLDILRTKTGDPIRVVVTHDAS